MVKKSAKVLDRHELDRPLLIKEKLYSIIAGDQSDPAIERLQSIEPDNYKEWDTRSNKNTEYSNKPGKTKLGNSLARALMSKPKRRQTDIEKMKYRATSARLLDKEKKRREVGLREQLEWFRQYRTKENVTQKE